MMPPAVRLPLMRYTSNGVTAIRNVSICVYVAVCVCVREREKDMLIYQLKRFDFLFRPRSSINILNREWVRAAPETFFFGVFLSAVYPWVLLLDNAHRFLLDKITLSVLIKDDRTTGEQFGGGEGVKSIAPRRRLYNTTILSEVSERN